MFPLPPRFQSQARSVLVVAAGLTSFASLVVTSAAAAPALGGCDYNNNGVCDAADYTVWRDLLNTNGPLPNESVSFGIVDQEDYKTWKEGFGDAVPGGGAMAPPMSGLATPEPTSAALFISGWLLLAWNHRRRCCEGAPVHRGSSPSR